MRGTIIERFKVFKDKGRAGFTLIEVMLAVAVISILAGIMVPNFNEMINRMNWEKHRANMISIHTAADLAHLSDEPLSEDKIRKHSKILNTDVSDIPKEMFYTVNRAEETGIIYVRYQDHRGTVYKYDSTMSDDWNGEINGGATDEDLSKPMYGDWYIIKDGYITGLTQKGKDNHGIELIIPDVIEGQKVIGIADNAFDSGGSRASTLPRVRSVVIPEGVEHIGKDAFFRVPATKVVLPSTVKFIDDRAFIESFSLDSINLPQGLTYIGAEAFYKNALREVNLPDTLKYLGRRAFSKNKIRRLNIPNGISEVGVEAFGYNALSSLSIPSSVKTIKSEAFRDNSLIQVTFSEGLEEIHYASFYQNNIKEVILPESLRVVEDYALGQNDAVSKLTIKNPNTNYHYLSFSNRYFNIKVAPPGVGIWKVVDGQWVHW